MAEPKPRTDPPRAMCGWCGNYDTLDNLRVSPAGFGQYHVMLGNTWPIHSACLMEWYDGGDLSNRLKHPEVVVGAESGVPVIQPKE